MFGHREMTATEVGVLYAFISYLARVIEPLIQITMQFSQLQQSVVASARVATLLDEGAARDMPTTHARGSGQRQQRARRRHPPSELRLQRRPAGAARFVAEIRRAISSASSATRAAASRPCCRCCCASIRRSRAASWCTACRSMHRQ
jgi:ABC-type multidrug transport system fused ATPase/permease subunit